MMDLRSCAAGLRPMQAEGKIREYGSLLRQVRDVLTAYPETIVAGSILRSRMTS